jgi:proline dehydrogenase
MLKKVLLYLSQASWARAIATNFFVTRRMAQRFIAGETLQQAITTTQDLNRNGLSVTLDYLGESVARAEDTREVVDTYNAIIEAIHAQNLNATISLKPTHLGLDIDRALCVDNIKRLTALAHQYGIGVTLDMESSAYVDVTLEIYRQLRDEFGFDNIGTVIQSMLYRSQADMRQLASEGARIRLVKGAYLEPKTVAYPDKTDVDKAYLTIMQDYLAHPAPAYLEVATHDDKMIQPTIDFVNQHGLTTDRYEFQMLYGIRNARQVELAQQGHPTRVYVPFGVAWYPYFMRRLAERPANVWFLLRSLFKS